MPGRGGVQKIIMSGYLKRYFNDFELEAIVEHHFEEDKQMKLFSDILMRNDFPDVFTDGTYRSAVMTFIESIERQYPGIIARKEQEKLGIRIKPKKKIKKKVAARIGKEKKTQTSATGTTYTRIINRGTRYRWDKNQTRTLQINKERVSMGIISKKEAVKEIAMLTGRSEKAVKSKYYRI